MGFAAGLRACVQSIRRLHADVPPILVLRPAGQTLTIADVDAVIPFDPASYESIPCAGLYFGREVFYKLEVFRLRGYERIVYLDCDTLVVDDISPLWDPTQVPRSATSTPCASRPRWEWTPPWSASSTRASW